jgi:hypothetical protein
MSGGLEGSESLGEGRMHNRLGDVDNRSTFNHTGRRIPFNFRPSVTLQGAYSNNS